MAGFTDLLGSLLQQGMSQSSGKRIGNAMGAGNSAESLEGLMGKLARQMGGAQATSDSYREPRRETPPARPASGGIGDLGDLFGGVLGGLANNKAVAGGLGALVGALMGGGAQSARGAVGGGGLAMLASLALSALQSAGQAPAQTPRALMDMPAGDDQQGLDDDAEVIVRAMINAAKADGEVGPKELEKIIGKLEQDGLSQQEKDFFMAEAGKAMDLSAVVASARGDAQMGAQIYAASLLAIEVDTAAEQRYMQQLAAGLSLHPEVALHIERTLGLA